MEYNSQQLREDLIIKRCVEKGITMGLACKQIGISKATYSRLEKSKIPDVETLGKVCSWLGTEPNKYFKSK